MAWSSPNNHAVDTPFPITPIGTSRRWIALGMRHSPQNFQDARYSSIHRLSPPLQRISSTAPYMSRSWSALSERGSRSLELGSQRIEIGHHQNGSQRIIRPSHEETLPNHGVTSSSNSVSIISLESSKTTYQITSSQDGAHFSAYNQTG